ncbi:Aldo/keto reductase [Epithele typhae]|uniref:Aldo/keto reductase n=1 Tax=Epithele typhae TaxID=378194 RepID=UPI002007C020|nr:Aldo/keto reductase [Epithele typhae]KAH9923751.1 Aldo/keto reductase [Epithele typhae]
MSPKMQYVRLGNSGLKVSRIILGCMSYGSPQWRSWVLPEEESMKHIKFAFDHGITTFDTANIYSNGLSETVLGKAIKEYNLPRDELVIMTKVWFISFVSYKPSPQRQPDLRPELGFINQKGLSRKHIFDAVQSCLKRLQVDYIDVLQVHRFDPETPISETMEALHDVVKTGWVRYLGMSSCWAAPFVLLSPRRPISPFGLPADYAITHNLTPFISMENHYNLLYREEEREMYPTLKMFGVGSTPWSPLARGVLTHPVGTAETTRSKTDEVEELAKAKGVSMARISLAWMLSKPHVTAPIVGTTSLANLEDILGALDVRLTEEEIEALEAPYTPLNVIGHR